MTHPGASLVRAWLRAAWHVPTEETDLQELTRCVCVCACVCACVMYSVIDARLHTGNAVSCVHVCVCACVCV